MRRTIATITDVAEKHLCCGCGTCAYVDPSIEMVDVVDQGRRPLVRGGGSDTGVALPACPGIALTHGPDADAGAPELRDGWGPVLAMWEGHAADPEIRYAGSSGGAATALALHCLEAEGMAGVLHTAARSDVPYLNESVFSSSRAELVAATGSRYAPASPCDRLDVIEAAADPCVFIGKPCDVAGARMAAAMRPALAERLGCTIAVFCAGTPSIAGTLEMIERMGVPSPESVRSVRYRGKGWPGDAEVTFADGEEVKAARLTYDASWGDILQRHRQWRCRICPDHTGEFADVAVGDPWYREIQPGEPGSSLVVARTERGRRLVEAAIRSGALVLERVGSEVLPASQPNLSKTRGATWGRVLTLRLMGAAAPRYRGLPMLRFWWSELSLREKAASIAGTARRIRRRRLRHRIPVVPMSTTEDR